MSAHFQLQYSWLWKHIFKLKFMWEIYIKREIGVRFHSLEHVPWRWSLPKHLLLPKHNNNMGMTTRDQLSQKLVKHAFWYFSCSGGALESEFKSVDISWENSAIKTRHFACTLVKFYIIWDILHPQNIKLSPYRKTSGLI